MLLDSYATPGAERLLLGARQRFDEPTAQRRALITESAAAIALLAAAAGLVVMAHAEQPFAVGSLIVVVVAYLAAARVRFSVGSAWTAPTQLVFVPMLFVLPMPWVPLVVAGCTVADLLPDLARRQAGMFRVATRVGDSFYSLGPVLVLVLSGHQVFSWDAAPWLVLALLAQFALDGATGLARTWFADGVAPQAQPQMVWLYLTDACLSCASLAVASDVGRFVRSSHERFDGLGYPDGLAGDEIPIESRIVAVCDAYNAMTTDRPYRPGRDPADAVTELRRCAGTQFDSLVVASLERVLAAARVIDDDLLYAPS